MGGEPCTPWAGVFEGRMGQCTVFLMGRANEVLRQLQPTFPFPTPRPSRGQRRGVTRGASRRCGHRAEGGWPWRCYQLNLSGEEMGT